MNLNMEQVEMLIDQIASKILQSGKQYDAIVAIARGGLVPAVYLSHILGVEKVIVLQGRETLTNFIDSPKKRPDVYGNEQEMRSLDDKNLLVVDDIVGSSMMLRCVKNYLIPYKPTCLDFVALIINENNLEKAGYTLDKILPDIQYYGITTRGWVVFPWENGGVQ